jgi:hypothetical protein
VEIEEDDYEVEEPVADAALMAMMPLSFGKQDKQRDLSESFAKTKRVRAQLTGDTNELQESKPAPAKVIPAPVNDDDDDDDDDDSSDGMIGPMPAEAEHLEEEEDDDDDDEFPTSHEVVLKDHHKVFPPELREFANDRQFQQ